MERSRQADPYAQLGLSEGASLQQVSRAYRKLVHESHPDTHQGDPAAVERFRATVEAHDWIVDRMRWRPEQTQSRSTIPIRRDPPGAGVPVRSSSEPPLRVGPVQVHAVGAAAPSSPVFRAGPVVGPLASERGGR